VSQRWDQGWSVTPDFGPRRTESSMLHNALWSRLSCLLCSVQEYPVADHAWSSTLTRVISAARLSICVRLSNAQQQVHERASTDVQLQPAPNPGNAGIQVKLRSFRCGFMFTGLYTPHSDAHGASSQQVLAVHGCSKEAVPVSRKLNFQRE
jgi:hypothetical protein